MDTKVYEDCYKAIGEFHACEDGLVGKLKELTRDMDAHESKTKAFRFYMSDLVKELKKKDAELSKEDQKEMFTKGKGFRETNLYIAMKVMAGMLETQMDYWDKAYKAYDKMPDK